jgi:hypothetical protein
MESVTEVKKINPEEKVAEIVVKVKGKQSIVEVKTTEDLITQKDNPIFEKYFGEENGQVVLDLKLESNDISHG